MNRNSNSIKVAIVIMFFVMTGAIKGFALGDNNNQNQNTATASPVISNTSSVGNVSASTGSVTDNSKTTNTNTAFGGSSFSSSSANGNGNGNGNNNGNLKNVGNVRNSGNSSQHQKQQQQQQSSQANGQTINDGNNKYYGNAWPSVTAAEGTSAGTASTIFGSLGIADTEKYKKIQVILQTLAAEIQAGLITKEDAAPMVASLNIKLMGTVKTQRTLFGFGPETSGKNLLNVLGLATADSFYKDGDAQGGPIVTGQTQAKAASAELDKTEVTNADVTTGNKGNVGH